MYSRFERSRPLMLLHSMPSVASCSRTLAVTRVTGVGAWPGEGKRPSRLPALTSHSLQTPSLDVWISLLLLYSLHFEWRISILSLFSEILWTGDGSQAAAALGCVIHWRGLSDLFYSGTGQNSLAPPLLMRFILCSSHKDAIDYSKS